MKNFMFILIAGGLLFSNAGPAAAQIKDPVKQVDKEGEQRVNKGIDKTIDKGFDKIEEGIGSLFKKKKTDKGRAAEPAKQTPVEKPADNPQPSAQQQSGPALKWAKYDFVPGDKIIFEDNLEGEVNGEFPSRWDLHDGNVEIAEFGGENVILFRVASEIVPFIKNPTQDYLPDIFTLEFDCYFFEDQNYQNYTIYFNDRKNQKGTGIDDVKTYWNQISQGSFQGWYPEASKSSFCKTEGWYHVSLLFNKRSLKVYLNDTRLLNVPNISGNPQGITIFGSYSSNDKTSSMIKNIRFAEAGQKLYEKYLQDGKIISNGIRFDVNKATLRPESMGIINEITTLMKDHPDINFSVQGHTDSDGDNDLNQKLSEDRAQTVMEQLVSMGISKERLSFKGYGESKPVAPNDTPEGKASNRRVEFVKKSGAASQNNSPSATAQTSEINKAEKKSGNYQSVTIGNQVWMQKNLDVVNFRNGDPVPQAKSEEEWQNMRYEKKASWCYYNFSDSGEGTSARLYNWFAVNDPRGLAPEGWKIPTAEDWDILRKKLGMGVAGKKMKSVSGWNGKNGTNISGFNGLPGGYCDYNGVFSSLGTESYWWGSNDDGSSWSPSIYLAGEDDYMHKHQMSKGSGLFVRCIR